MFVLRYEWLAELLEQEQRTRWMTAKRDAHGWWQMVDGKGTPIKSADVQRVEVLRGVEWWQMNREVEHPGRDIEMRCRVVLRACAYLQHLYLTVDAYVCQEPFNADSFALAPRLRTLRLVQNDSNQPADRLIASLTSLTCNNAHDVGVAALTDIASHSTLEELHITSSSAPSWLMPTGLRSLLRFRSTWRKMSGTWSA